MTIDTSLQVRIPNSVIIQMLEGKSILLNLQTNTYYGLNLVGTRMIQTLDKVDSIERAAFILVDEFDVIQETLTHDMVQLIQQLLRQGLLEVNGSPQ